jgi:hypothetical protein
MLRHVSRTTKRESVGRGFEPNPPYSEAVCKIRLAESSFMGGEVPASALGIQRFDGSLPSRPDNVQRFPDCARDAGLPGELRLPLGLGPK